MGEAQGQAEFREAAREVQRYLSGEIAPLMVADSFQTLASASPESAARVIAEWIQSQLGAPGARVPVSDYVFHSLKKLHILSEFDLVERTPLLRYLDVLGGLLANICPESERTSLRARLGRLAESTTASSTISKVEYLHGAGGTAAAAEDAGAGGGDSGAGEGVAREIRRLNLLLERLGSAPAPSGAQGASPIQVGQGDRASLLAGLFSTAAIEAQSSADLDRYLAQVQERGGATPMDQVFRTLGWSLPGWALPFGAPGAREMPGSRPVEAMQKIVSLAPDAEEAARRLREMVYTAVEQFNEGRLPQSVSILDAAGKLIEERRLDAAGVRAILVQAQDSLSEAVLRRCAEATEKHGLLKRVLGFFPGYGPEGLLEKLQGEEKREARKLLLVLLECQGDTCRPMLLDRLGACVRGEIRDEQGWFRRNLVFLLRRLQRSDDTRLDEEIANLRSTMAAGEPYISVREAIGALGRIVHSVAEQALIERLHRLETDLRRGAAAAGEESWDLLDRLCAALAGHGSPAALRTVAAHAFSPGAELGEAVARIDNLGRIDLSIDPEQLAALLQAIRDRMPTKVLGIVVKRVDPGLLHLVRAVSGTSTPDVRSVLEDVARRFERQEVAEEARQALSRLEPAQRARAAVSSKVLTGDLELFALPNLLQSLADSQATGELALFDAGQARVAVMRFARGRFTGCAAGRLQGEAAAHAVFERPFPGTFVFRSSATDGGEAPEGAIEVVPLILEGVRRHDEFQAALALVPDGMAFEPAGPKWTLTEAEEDAQFAGAVWAKAASGCTADACEAEIEADPYRVRTLYAHWLEEGALRPKTA